MSQEERAAINFFLISRFRDLYYMYKNAARDDKTEAIIEKVKGWDEWRALDQESRQFLKQELGKNFKEVHLANILGDMTRQELDQYSSRLRGASKSEVHSGRCCLHCKHYHRYMETKDIKKHLFRVCDYHRIPDVPEKPDNYDDALLIGIYPRKSYMLCKHFSFALPADY